jgi:hypothetical protein
VESIEHTPTTAPLLRTLEDVVRWTVATGASLVEVIHQDEYTLDVVVKRGDARYLVYDTS